MTRPQLIGSSGIAVGSTRYSGRPPRTEPTIPLQVEGEPLNEPHNVAPAITAALEHFELVVQAFDKAAGVMVEEVVRDQVLPSVQQLQEPVEAAQPALHDPLPPALNLPQSLRLRACAVEDRRQLLAQCVRLSQGWAGGKQRLQSFLFRSIQVSSSLAKGPQGVFEFIRRILGQFLAQAPHLLLVQLVHAIAIVARHMKHESGRSRWSLAGAPLGWQ